MAKSVKQVGDSCAVVEEDDLQTLKTGSLDELCSSPFLKKARLDYTFGRAIDISAGNSPPIVLPKVSTIVSYHRSDSGVFTVRTAAGETYEVCPCLWCVGTLCPDENIKCIFTESKQWKRPVLYSTTETEQYFACWCIHCKYDPSLPCAFEGRRACLRKFFKGNRETKLDLPESCVCGLCSYFKKKHLEIIHREKVQFTLQK
jgi:hypothetical protein